ncbi:hypothetical protein ACLOJK_013248 [Asimina triloba]
MATRSTLNRAVFDQGGINISKDPATCSRRCLLSIGDSSPISGNPSRARQSNESHGQTFKGASNSSAAITMAASNSLESPTQIRLPSAATYVHSKSPSPPILFRHSENRQPRHPPYL